MLRFINFGVLPQICMDVAVSCQSWHKLAQYTSGL